MKTVLFSLGQGITFPEISAMEVFLFNKAPLGIFPGSQPGYALFFHLPKAL